MAKQKGDSSKQQLFYEQLKLNSDKKLVTDNRREWINQNKDDPIQTFDQYCKQVK